MKELFGRLGRPNAFTWQVAAIALVPSIILVLAGPWARLGGSPLPWMIMGLAGSAVATLAMVPFRATVLRAQGRPSRPVVTVFAFALAGSIRGVVVGQLAHADGLLPNPQVGQRLLSGSLSGVVYLGIISLMVQSVKDHADSSRQLASEKDRLARTRAASGSELERVSADIVERVREQMIARLQNTISALSNAGSQLTDGAKSVAHLIDSTLKPLVDEITSQPDNRLLRAPETDASPASDSGALFSDTTRIRPLSPLPTAVATALAGSASFIPLAGPARMVVASTLIFFGLVFVLRLMTGPMGWAARTLGRLGRAVFLTLSLELSGLAITLLVLGAWKAFGLDLGARVNLSLISFSPLVVVMIGWGIAVTSAWNRRADEIDSELAAAVESLKTQNASLNRELAIERDRLARFVHGPVQDNLLAAWTLLERGGDRLPDDADLAAAALQIGKAIQMLEERITAPQGSEDLPPTVAELVGSYARVWDGLVEIECFVDPEAQESLAEDRLAAGSVGEVIREGIANAARHARSERVKVSVTTGELGSVLVVVEAESRGDLPPAPETAGAKTGRRGLGSATLDQLTSSWHLERLEGGSRLTAAVAVTQRAVFV